MTDDLKIKSPKGNRSTKAALKHARRGLKMSRRNGVALPNGLRRKRARRLLQICRMLNRTEVSVAKLANHAKWLNKRNFGQFALSEDINAGPGLTGFTEHSRKNSVVLIFTLAALPYVEFIFRYPEDHVVLPSFLQPQKNLVLPAGVVHEPLTDEDI